MTTETIIGKIKSRMVSEKFEYYKINKNKNKIMQKLLQLFIYETTKVKVCCAGFIIPNKNLDPVHWHVHWIVL